MNQKQALFFVETIEILQTQIKSPVTLGILKEEKIVSSQEIAPGIVVGFSGDNDIVSIEFFPRKIVVF